MAQRDRSRGLLIAFEGPDGSGKTTQRKLLHKWLRSQGHPVVSTRWASSPLVKPLIRVRKKIRALSPLEFSLLHAIDFRHRLDSEILPALWAGKTVLADRYLFAALARDAARGLDFDWLLHAYAPLLWPDLVVYFSMPSQSSSRRVASTRQPRFYESGQDVTGVEDPLVSYRGFIDRVIREYRQPRHDLQVRAGGRGAGRLPAASACAAAGGGRGATPVARVQRGRRPRMAAPDARRAGRGWR